MTDQLLRFLLVAVRSFGSRRRGVAAPPAGRALLRLFAALPACLRLVLVVLAVSPAAHAGEGIPTLQIAKSFGAASVPVNGSTTLTVQLTNPNALGGSDAAFIDPFPAGLALATPPNVVNNCPGTLTAAAGGTLLRLEDGAGFLAPSASCTVTVNVTATSAGILSNTATVTRDGVNNYATSTAVLNVLGAIGAVASIPTLGEWALLAMGMLMAAWAARTLRGDGVLHRGRRRP